MRILQLLTTAVSGAKVVPIFLPLPLLQGALPTPSGIDGFMAAQLGITNTTLVDLCREYRVVVIMDSLDEVRDPEDALTEFLSRNPALATCGVVLTCRSHTVRDASRLFSPAAVRTINACPMEECDIQKWLRAEGLSLTSIPHSLRSACVRPFVMATVIVVLKSGRVCGGTEHTTLF